MTNSTSSNKFIQQNKLVILNAWCKAIGSKKYGKILEIYLEISK